MAINFNTLKNASSEAGNLVKKLPTTQDIVQKYTGNTFKIRENFGIEGFNFSILQSIDSKMETEFTEHYLESGVFVNDHAVDKPITLDLVGIITEVVLRPSILQNALDGIDNKLGIVSTYTPSLTQGVQQSFSKLANKITRATNYIDGAISSAKSLTSFLADLKPNISNQQKSIEILDSIRKSRKLLTIESYLGTIAYQNMAITSINPQIQIDRDGKNMTTLRLSFKEIRFGNVEIRTSSKKEKKALGRVAGQLSSVVPGGQQQGASTQRNVSFLKSFFS